MSDLIIHFRELSSDDSAMNERVLLAFIADRDPVGSRFLKALMWKRRKRHKKAQEVS